MNRKNAQAMAAARTRDTMARNRIRNAQAMAAASKRRLFDGDRRLTANDSVDGDTWLTPRQILSTLGEFDLDPCAAPQNPHWVCGRSFVLPENDGLVDPWFGRVFLNPPFSKTAPWIRRHAEHGNGITLVPASVESRVWRDVVWAHARGVLLLHGRTRFCHPDGSVTVGRPLRSIALIAWSEADRQIIEDSPLAGVFIERWRQR